MSHSPLMDRNRAPAEVEAKWSEGLNRARQVANDCQPDLCIVFFPDHLNGFLYNLLPTFCIGTAGRSLGDFGTTPGSLDIPEQAAAECAAHCIASGIDIAVSYDMLVDHGCVQPLEMLSVGQDLTRLIPVFINCAAPPLSTFARVRALGSAIGRWAAARQERILLIGSGGLSHDPPLPSVAAGSGADAQRLRQGAPASFGDRLARQRNVFSEGALFRSGTSRLKPLNAKWDGEMMDALAAGRLDILDDQDDEAVTSIAGRGAHEIRCWIAALSALGAAGDFQADQLVYEPVDEWITGMGILTARPTGTPPAPKPRT
jgi:2,3-dihydroxyphenylpropionate 1,2-dioxygenase